MSVPATKGDWSSPYLADNFSVSQVLDFLRPAFEERKSVCKKEAISVVQTAITIGSVSNHRFFGSETEISISAENIHLQPRSCIAAPVVLLTSGSGLVMGTEGEDKGLVSFYSPQLVLSAKTIRIGLNIEFLATVKKVTIFCTKLIVADKPPLGEDPLAAIRPQLDIQLENLDPVMQELNKLGGGDSSACEEDEKE